MKNLIALLALFIFTGACFAGKSEFNTPTRDRVTRQSEVEGTIYLQDPDSVSDNDQRITIDGIFLDFERYEDTASDWVNIATLGGSVIVPHSVEILKSPDASLVVIDGDNINNLIRETSVGNVVVVGDIAGDTYAVGQSNLVFLTSGHDTGFVVEQAVNSLNSTGTTFYVEPATPHSTAVAIDSIRIQGVDLPTNVTVQVKVFDPSDLVNPIYVNVSDEEFLHNDGEPLDETTGTVRLRPNAYSSAGESVRIVVNTSEEVILKGATSDATDIYLEVEKTTVAVGFLWNGSALTAFGDINAVGGDVSATTFLGELNGTINSNTTGKTESPLDNSTKIATTEYVDKAVLVEDHWYRDVPLTMLVPQVSGDNIGSSGYMRADSGYYSHTDQMIGYNNTTKVITLGDTNTTSIIFDADRIGKGTNSPSTDVHVASTDDPSIATEYTDAGSFLEMRSGNAKSTIGYDSSEDGLLIGPTAAIRSAPSTGLFLDASGNAGVKVLSPQANLDAGGTASTGRSLQVRSGEAASNTDSAQIIMSYNGNSYNVANGYGHSIRTRHSAVNNYNNAIDFWLWNTGTGSSSTLGDERVMTLTGERRVGTGTGSPEYPSHLSHPSAGYALIETDSNSGDTALLFRNSVGENGYVKGGVYFKNDGSGFGKGDVHICLNNVSSSTNVTVTDAVMSLYHEGNVSVNDGDLQVINVDEGTTGAKASLYHSTTTPENGNEAGVFDYNLDNSASEETTFARTTVTASEVTDGAESGTYALQTMRDGALGTRMEISREETVFPLSGDSIGETFEIRDPYGYPIFVADGKLDIEATDLNTPYGAFGKTQNRLLYSEDLTKTSWLKFNGATVAGDNTTAPNGENTADKLTRGTADLALSQAAGLINGTVYTCSFWAMASSHSSVDIEVSLGNGVASDLTIPDAYWKRYHVTQVAGATGDLDISLITASSSIWLWGLQVNDGSTPYNYAKTAINTITVEDYGLAVNGDITMPATGEININDALQINEAGFEHNSSNTTFAVDKRGGENLDLSVYDGGLFNVYVDSGSFEIDATALNVATDTTITGDLSVGGLFGRSLSSSITASSTQTQGQQPLTANVNNVTVIATDNDVVTLPAASATYSFPITIYNSDTNTLQIFPASGDDLGAGVNASTTLSPGANVTFGNADDTNWRTE
jgi:hypothetical protein